MSNAAEQGALTDLIDAAKEVCAGWRDKPAEVGGPILHLSYAVLALDAVREGAALQPAAPAEADRWSIVDKDGRTVALVSEGSASAEQAWQDEHNARWAPHRIVKPGASAAPAEGATPSGPASGDVLAALNEIHNWLVCWPIASAEDMAQSFEHMEAVAGRALGYVPEGVSAAEWFGEERATPAPSEQAEQATREGQRTCIWTDDGDDGWATECGNRHVLIADDPIANGMMFCCYCGGRLTALSEAASW